MADRTPERLLRLLGMVAYLDRHPGVAVEDLAAHFGVSPGQVLKDVDTLWMSGTPGYWPDDLIDFDAASLESGVVRLTQSRGMGRALRLGTREAVVLVAALRALREAVGDALDPVEREVLTGTLDVLTAATGEAAATVDVQLAVEADPQVVATARSALRDGRRVHLRYVDASDALSERDVDPWQIVTGDERSYLQAWCHSAGGERLFRLDRILDLRVLDEPVTRRPARAPDPTVFRPAPEHAAVTIDLSGRARWVAEQLPVEETLDLDDGGFRVTLRVASRAWLDQLLLRLAPDVRAVRPGSVAAEVAEAARRALLAYDDGPDRDRPDRDEPDAAGPRAGGPEDEAGRRRAAR
ncbi:helix-turn-helix transcriptional regulator [Cellulomonas carbonis]|uniref:Transcriptional regulator n=1 Tax=Cellulomonas carbonis T26 TaxID=947969 RepID=A0A0A0BTI6_9CELL|nr:WYL domain-containing protein [Cellulomonas carbonis]KGM11718.1 transcriptional regulator [Cellulomonas carbonis T26]GGB94435.1 protein pafC [Cellulomonas carbonis]